MQYCSKALAASSSYVYTTSRECRTVKNFDIIIINLLIQVHVRTHKCNAVSCNCGVAAREDNDVIVVDFCKGAIQTARFASKGIPANGTKLLRDRIGRNFIVSRPFIIIL